MPDGKRTKSLRDPHHDIRLEFQAGTRHRQDGTILTSTWSRAGVKRVFQSGTPRLDTQRGALRMAYDASNGGGDVGAADPGVRLGGRVRDPVSDSRLSLFITPRPFLSVPALGVGRVHVVEGPASRDGAGAGRGLSDEPVHR